MGSKLAEPFRFFIKWIFVPFFILGFIIPCIIYQKITILKFIYSLIMSIAVTIFCIICAFQYIMPYKEQKIAITVYIISTVIIFELVCVCFCFDL